MHFGKHQSTSLGSNIKDLRMRMAEPLALTFRSTRVPNILHLVKIVVRGVKDFHIIRAFPECTQHQKIRFIVVCTDAFIVSGDEAAEPKRPLAFQEMTRSGCVRPDVAHHWESEGATTPAWGHRTWDLHLVVAISLLDTGSLSLKVC